VLQTKEPTPTPYPFVIFTFGFTIESIKEFGGASIGGFDMGIPIDYHGSIMLLMGNPKKKVNPLW
jgi:hypothetical protein